jgi:putative transposase
MKTTYLKVGLHLTLNNTKYQIAKIVLSGIYHLERLSDGGVLSFSKHELMLAFSRGDLILDGGKKSEAKRVARNLDCLAEEERTTSLRRHEFVVSAIQKLGSSPTTVGLPLVIEQTSRKLEILDPPSVSTVYRWWAQFVKSGKDIMSLVNKKPGKSGNRAFSTIVLDEISNAINSVFLTREKGTIKDAYDTLRVNMERINELRLEPLKVPSRANFYRTVNSLDKYTVIAAREGKRVADECFRMTGAGPDVRYILERVEVDHSTLDVFVIDDLTGQTIGRPFITLLIDGYSRMLLGWYIGFEPPSQLSVMRALRHAILPKELEGNAENCLPTYGIPNVLICDNGLEFHSHLLKRLCVELNIDLQFCPKHQPRYKGKIERVLGTLNREVCHRIAGTSFSNISQRADYDSIAKACVSLNQLRELVMDWVLNDYSQRIHRTTKRVPTKLWTEGLQVIEPNLPESVLSLQFALTQQIRRTLTNSGIDLYELNYYSTSLQVLRTRSTKNFKVTVRYDVEDMGAIWVLDDQSNDFLKVPNSQPEYAEGLTLVQHRYIQAEIAKKGLTEQNEKAVLFSRERLKEKIKSLEKSKKIRCRQKAARLSQHLTEPKNSINAITAPADKPQPSEPFTIDNTLSFDIKSLGGSS